MKPITKSVLIALGWIWVFVFVMIGVLGAGLHIVDHFNSVADRPALATILREDIYGREFFAHWLDFRNYPVSRMTHMVFGMIFVLIAPLQFIHRIRTSRPRLHGALGRTALLLSVVLIATGWMFAFPYTYTGFPEQVPTVIYTIIYAWLIFMGVKSIRAHNIGQHREWMVRAFSMMMGISATRVWFYLFLKTTAIPSNHFFSSAFWLGLGVNLLVAEIWINLTRGATPHSTPVPRGRVLAGLGAPGVP